MDPDVANFGIVAVIIVVMVAALSRITISLVRGLAKKSTTSELPNVRQMEQRFDQLQQSVDAIAVEVERIAEAQRFSAKLLAGKSELNAESRIGTLDTSSSSPSKRRVREEP
jgi:predicted RND superfamily exporter protein